MSTIFKKNDRAEEICVILRYDYLCNHLNNKQFLTRQNIRRFAISLELPVFYRQLHRGDSEVFRIITARKRKVVLNMPPFSGNAEKGTKKPRVLFNFCLAT